MVSGKDEDMPSPLPSASNSGNDSDESSPGFVPRKLPSTAHMKAGDFLTYMRGSPSKPQPKKNKKWFPFGGSNKTLDRLDSDKSSRSSSRSRGAKSVKFSRKTSDFGLKKFKSVEIRPGESPTLIDEGEQANVTLPGTPEGIEDTEERKKKARRRWSTARAAIQVQTMQARLAKKRNEEREQDAAGAKEKEKPRATQDSEDEDEPAKEIPMLATIEKQKRKRRMPRRRTSMEDVKRWIKKGIHSIASHKLKEKDELAAQQIDPRNKYVIHPHSLYRSIWDKLISFLVIYAALSVPYTIAFGDSEVGIAPMEVFFDMLFIVDVVVNMFTAYYDEAGLLVQDLPKIRRRYFRGWAWIDIPASFPFELILTPVLQSASGGKLTSSIALFKMLKLPRLLRIGRLFKNIELLESLLSAGRIIKLLLLYLYISHLFGCFLYFLCSSAQEPTQTWTWAHGVHSSMSGVPTWIRYTQCGYGAFLMLIGENIEPGPGGEQVFAICVMLVGACLYAIIFGQMAVIVNDLNRGSSRKAENLGNIQEHMRNLRLPLDTQHRVREYFNEMWSLNRCLDRNTFFNSLSSSLNTEVHLFLYGEMVQKVPFFKAIDTTCLLRLVHILDNEMFLAGDYLIREHEFGGEMYFLRRGVVAVFKQSNPEKIFCYLTDGAYFGEVALVRGIRRTAMIQAKKFCDTSKLRIEALEELFEEFPEEGELIMKRIEKKIGRYKDQDAKRAFRTVHRVSKAVGNWRRKNSENNLLAAAAASSRRRRSLLGAEAPKGSGRKLSMRKFSNNNIAGDINRLQLDAAIMNESSVSGVDSPIGGKSVSSSSEESSDDEETDLR